MLFAVTSEEFSYRNILIGIFLSIMLYGTAWLWSLACHARFQMGSIPIYSAKVLSVCNHVAWQRSRSGAGGCNDPVGSNPTTQTKQFNALFV